MRSVKIEELSREGFWPFGFYANLINPEADKIGDKPIEFFRDMAQLNLGNGAAVASFSTCRVEPRPFIIDTVEYHTNTGEGILPLDNDVYIHVGIATGGEVPFDSIRVFRVPKGTAVVLRSGVWHHAPYTVNDAANVLIVLPERTYTNDCKVIELTEEEKIEIEL